MKLGSCCRFLSGSASPASVQRVLMEQPRPFDVGASALGANKRRADAGAIGVGRFNPPIKSALIYGTVDEPTADLIRNFETRIAPDKTLGQTVE
jgi:hypothetical protein